MDVFLREFEAPTDFSGVAHVFEYEVCEPKAYVCHVAVHRGEEPPFRESIRYTVRDRGSLAHPTAKKAIVVVRRENDLIPLTDDCGKLLGFLRSSFGRFECYVFEALRAPTAIGSSVEEPTSHQPVKEHAIGCHLRDIVACSCVFDGPEVHGHPSAPIASPDTPESWWEFPGEEKASGA